MKRKIFILATLVLTVICLASCKSCKRCGGGNNPDGLISVCPQCRMARHRHLHGTARHEGLISKRSSGVWHHNTACAGRQGALVSAPPWLRGMHTTKTCYCAHAQHTLLVQIWSDSYPLTPPQRFCLFNFVEYTTPTDTVLSYREGYK